MLNRIARNPGGEDVALPVLRKQIDAFFEQMRNQSEGDSRLAAQLKKVELPLVFFVDSMIAESKLCIAMQWHKNRIAYESSELAGDEKFFDLLDETLGEQGPEANERLAVYYTCLGLGFTGWYAGQPEYLRKKMLQVAQRLPASVIEPNQTARLTPEAYEHTDTRNLVEPPGVKMATIAVAFAGLAIVVLAVNFYLYRTASRGLADSLREILRHDLTVVVTK
jgi:type IV/VI secretion system ImpK/VasF family protein